MALPPSQRFSGRRDISQFIRATRKVDTPLGRVASRTAPAGQGRIQFVIPTDVSKRSTERNRIRRHLDEWARARSSKEPALSSRDLVVFVDPTTSQLSRGSLWYRADLMLRKIARSL